MKICHVVGARPNFMKASPVIKSFSKEKNIVQDLVHTGQHYDKNMSEIFFEQLNIPKPSHNLNVGSSSHAQQTAKIMIEFEKYLYSSKPDIVIVYGDVNSTVATSMVCAKESIPIVHVEAGLRSGDLSMPEEINRIVTDRIASLLLTPSKDGDRNLKKEGIASQRIKFVGNVMIDTLISLQNLARSPADFNLENYFLVTLHRPSNVDNPNKLLEIIDALEKPEQNIVFVIHPRTKKRIEEFNIKFSKKMHFLPPQGYLEFLFLQKNCLGVITDSGGLQEETTYLNKPCLTLRENTERPVTIFEGTNTLIGSDYELLSKSLAEIQSGKYKQGKIPLLWDGNASHRVKNEILDFGF